MKSILIMVQALLLILATSTPRAKYVYPHVSAAIRAFLNNRMQVKGFDPTPSGLRECLLDADIVLIPAGVPRKPGMTRDGMFPQFPPKLVAHYAIVRPLQYQRLHRPRSCQGCRR